MVLQVKVIGSTYRLTPSAAKFAKYLPLDALSFRYVAWEVHVEVSLFLFAAATMPLAVLSREGGLSNRGAAAVQWAKCHALFY